MTETHKVRSGAKDVFLYLLLIVTLYISAFNLIALLFQYVNFSFPDALDYYYFGITDTIRWSSSSLFVAFPIFLLVSWLIGKETVTIPEKREIGVRRWLTYLTLFIAAVTIIVDLILLVFNFYSGELTTKFLLKLIIVLVITAMIFGYYLWDLGQQKTDGKKNRNLAIATSILVIISIAGGFFYTGSPAKQRALRLDQDRIGNLQWIQNEIINYWQNKEQLPENLAALTNNISGFTAPTDPESKKPYEYRILTKTSFELCGEFSEAGIPDNSQSRYYVEPGREQNWQHEKGRVCFERNIDPELYPQVTKPVIR
jgi:hypothetical protein